MNDGIIIADDITVPGHRAAVTTVATLWIRPQVKSADGQPITDEQRGLALLTALRGVGFDFCLDSPLLPTAPGAQHYLLRVEINGEPICAIRYQPVAQPPPVKP